MRRQCLGYDRQDSFKNPLITALVRMLAGAVFFPKRGVGSNFFLESDPTPFLEAASPGMRKQAKEPLVCS
jgi:hypothetical protein